MVFMIGNHTLRLEVTYGGVSIEVVLESQVLVRLKLIMVYLPEDIFTNIRLILLMYLLVLY